MSSATIDAAPTSFTEGGAGASTSPFARARPTSLYQPERFSLAAPLIDTASYSPFPAISGARRDPFGLDNFLLHPEDRMWSYIAPAPASLPVAAAGSGSDAERTAASASAPAQAGMAGRKGPMAKKASLMALRGSSPLSQPPIDGGDSHTHEAARAESGLTRRRSKSLSSTRALGTDTDTDTDLAPASNGASASTLGKKSRRVLFGRRKSISSASALSEVSTMSLSASNSGSGSNTPNASQLDVSKLPFPSIPGRKSSSADAGSTCSTASLSSSEGPGTPADSPMLVPADAGSVPSKGLVEAQVQAQGSKLDVGKMKKDPVKDKDKESGRKGFMGFFNRRSSSSLAISTLISGTAASASSSGLSSPASISPNSSASDLSSSSSADSSHVQAHGSTNATGVTSSDQIQLQLDVTSEPASRVTPTPEQRSTAILSDHMRRSTFRKLNQLRRPSPHPLAAQLRRQYSHLPQEVIRTLEASQAVYPRSVNWYSPDISASGSGSGVSDSGHGAVQGQTGAGVGLQPAQRGLWCTLAVKIVLDKLDEGALPTEPFVVPRRPSPPPLGATGSTAPPTGAGSGEKDRPRRSMADFTARLPFEERHVVFYPEGAWSPVSMARKGFGVWDLDFSRYILAMADVAGQFAGHGYGAGASMNMGAYAASALRYSSAQAQDPVSAVRSALPPVPMISIDHGPMSLDGHDGVEVISSPLMGSFPLDSDISAIVGAVDVDIQGDADAARLLAGPDPEIQAQHGEQQEQDSSSEEDEKADAIVTPPAEMRGDGEGVPEIRIGHDLDIPLRLDLGDKLVADRGRRSLSSDRDDEGGLMEEINAIGRFLEPSVLAAGQGEERALTRSVSADCITAHRSIASVVALAGESALDDEDEDEDDVPLSKSRVVLRKASMPMLGASSSSSRREAAAMAAEYIGGTRIIRPPIPSHTTMPLNTNNGSTSTSVSVMTHAKRSSSSDRLSNLALQTPEQRAKAQERALAEVARARERRLQLERGEVDRRAEGQRRREEEGKRRSTAFDLEVQRQRQEKVKPQSTGGSGSGYGHKGADKRKSSANLVQMAAQPHLPAGQRPNSIAAPVQVKSGQGDVAREERRRTQSATAPKGPSKRYHSFYELPAVGASTDARPTSTASAAASPAPAPKTPRTPGGRTASMVVPSIPMAMPMGMGMPQMQAPMEMHPAQMQMAMQIGMYPQPQHHFAHIHAQALHGNINGRSISMMLPNAGPVPVMPTPLQHQASFYSARGVSMAQHFQAAQQAPRTPGRTGTGTGAGKHHGSAIRTANGKGSPLTHAHAPTHHGQGRPGMMPHSGTMSSLALSSRSTPERRAQ